MKVYCAEAGGWLPRIYDWIKDENMKGYCAEMRQFDLIFKARPNIPKFNILFSFFSSQDTSKYMPFAKNLLIDSGAFSLQKKKSLTHTQADKFFKDYLKFVEQNYENPIIQGFFELDIQNIIGYDAVKQYRKELFEVTDKIIPVWHKSEKMNEFKRMTFEYDWIGVSSVSDREVKREAYPKLINYSHKNNCKIHGLGMLNQKLLKQLPFDSVDGTSWFKVARFGRRKGRKVNSKYIYDNQYELTFIELIEHIKFQEEMYNYWKGVHND